MNAHAVPAADVSTPRPAIWRDANAIAINAVLNDPSVRADVADLGEGALDITTTATNPANYILMGEHGGVAAIAILPGIYEVHTQILPAGRGAWAFAFAREFTHWMFTRTDAYELITRVPHDHLGARALASRSGMKIEFSRENGCTWRGVTMVADVFSMRIQDWMKDARDIEAVGEQFHEDLNAKALALGITASPHADDPVHNRYLGAAVEMVRNGQMRKGVAVYCRWALAARHPAAALIAEDPPTIQFDLGTMTFLPNGDFEVRT